MISFIHLVGFSSSRVIGGVSTQKRLLHKILTSQDHYTVFEVYLNGLLDCIQYALRSIKSPSSRHILFNAGTWQNYPLIVLMLLFKRRVVLFTSFHPPHYVQHKLKSLFSLILINIFGLFGLRLVVNSEYEKSYFPLCKRFVYPLLPDPFSKNITQSKKYDFVFLGRPTSQKGFDKFLNIAQLAPDYTFLAIIPSKPSHINLFPKNVSVHLAPDDSTVSLLLSQSRVLLLPSDYESLGYAQYEALVNGCCVPILGKWPFWDFISNHIPLLDLQTLFLKDSFSADVSLLTKLLYLLDSHSSFGFESYKLLIQIYGSNVNNSTALFGFMDN